MNVYFSAIGIKLEVANILGICTWIVAIPKYYLFVTQGYIELWTEQRLSGVKWWNRLSYSDPSPERKINTTYNIISINSIPHR